jgi:hypothetical protein
MSEATNRDVIERFFKAADSRDWRTMRDCYHSDAIEEWPQSGERLNGVDNIMAVNENYPAHPGLKSTRILAAGDVVIGEAELDYSGTSYNLISVFEFEDGKVKKEVDYFCEPFEAEDWRAQWVEKMCPPRSELPPSWMGNTFSGITRFSRAVFAYRT